MTVLDQGSLQPFLAKDVPPLTTLPPSPLMIRVLPQQFRLGRGCAHLGGQPRASVSP
jgi:hypothetical protein